MSGRFNDLTGKKFGKLKVIEYAYRKHSAVYWKCICDCGTEKIVVANSLNRGITTCCYYCAHKKHGLTNSRLYGVWAIMKQRCYNEKAPNFPSYGGRGITMCDEWKNDFMTFHDWAYANGYDENATKGECTIDRIDVNGNYEPSNCRWATRQEQNFNKRNTRIFEFKGKVQHLYKWAEEYNIPFSTLLYRLQSGMSMGEALTKPMQKKRSGEETKILVQSVLDDIDKGIVFSEIANKYNISVSYVRLIKNKKEN